MAKGLVDFMEECPSRMDLYNILAPRSRTIYMNKHHEELGGSIESILRLAKNSIEQQRQPVEFLLPSSGKVPVSLKFPEYGLYSAVAAQPSNKVAIMLNLLRAIQEAVYSGQIKTIRDVYYSNVQLYGKQSKVDQWITTIARCFELNSKNPLNVIPAQKGLCFTTKEIRIVTRGRMDCIPAYNSTLIPHMEERSMCQVIMSKPMLRVIVVEKEAIYNKLINSGNGKLLQDSIIVTGKGYPDFLTRLFLNKLQCIPCIESWEIYTDADPHGMDIASKYMLNKIDHYKCGKLIHKGVFLSQLIAQRQRQIQFLPLTERDNSLAVRLLEKATDTDCKHSRLAIELQRQIFLQKKAEMDGLERSGYVGQ
ncbi:uncharacterized protein ZBAI_08594 [Zygosaccharomyces bailii ISA1307]|nr:uncharacterized protein ZBAI_08594 [Zygosaccharomyces bailii ISA1307]